MAALAPLMRAATAFVESGFPVRTFLPAVVNFFVTGLTGLRSHIFRAVLHRRSRWFALLTLIGSWRRRQKREHEECGCDPQAGLQPGMSFSECDHVHTFSRTLLCGQCLQDDWIIGIKDGKTL